jgi:hypothetical protein
METAKDCHPLLLRRAEAQRMLGVGPSKYKQIVAAGALREIPIGRRGRRVPYAELERYIAECLAKREALE